jgi:hypothetical protein
MSSQLPIDCLNEIFEHLERDTITLHSCLLVNRLCCEISVRILWKDVSYSNYYKPNVSLSIINTLITCLPKESKDLLGIGFITSTQKPPLFNYPSFCKTISVNKIYGIIDNALRNQQLINLGDLNYNKRLLAQEILKMYMNQISSLKLLDHSTRYSTDDMIKFIYSPGFKICLKNLVILKCYSNICSEFFYQLSQISHNIQSLIINFVYFNVSDGLTDLISLQNNLKSLKLIDCNKYTIRKITPSLVKSSLTITKLEIDTNDVSLSFISMFINLQELILDLDPENPKAEDTFEGFDQLQYVKFPQLKVFELNCFCPKSEMLIKFLEINGKNLIRFDGFYDCKTKNLTLAKFCPNLKNLSITFNDYKEDELESLKIVLTSCQYLESISIQFNYKFITSKNLFDVLIKYSPKTFHKLSLCLFSSYKKLEGLEELFINRKNNISQKPLSLTILEELHGVTFDSNLIKLIEKYMKMGVIKEFTHI